jgi:hypothetical protein
METDATTIARIAALNRELEAIYAADTIYWRQRDHTREATVEYQRRQERLETIRSELNQKM